MTQSSCRSMKTAACAMAFCAFSNFTNAATIHVPADHATIQAAINAATNGDIILVAPGTYNEAINFNNKALTLESTGGPGVTTLNAAGANTSAVTIPTPTQAGTVTFRGFKVTGGTGTLAGSGAFASATGGGFRIVAGETVLENCHITANSAEASVASGAGIAYGGGGTLTLRNCLLSDNTASAFWITSSSSAGGGISVSTGGIVVLIDCSLTNNVATASGAVSGVANGGAIRLSGATATFINCIIDGNSVMPASAGQGGALSAVSSSHATFINCRISHNQAPTTIKTPGLYTSNSTLHLLNCTVVNNTIGGKPPSDTVGGMMHSGGIATVSNCILFNNSGAQISGSTVSSSCVQGGFAGPGNIADDPQFVDATNGDYRLSTGSPCVDVGDLASLPSDSFDLDDDGDTKEFLPVDFNGERRVVNGYLDMGAHEWQRTCMGDIAPSSPGVAGNGVVDVDDLLAVINAWGECDICVGDVDGDNDIDVDDLLAVINGWGSCK
jgi:hypothetical protein